MEAEKLFQLTINDVGRGFIASLLLTGSPGTGKTRLAQMFAEVWGAGLLFYQCHQGTGKEELLYDLDVRGVVERLAGGLKSEPTSYIKKGLLYQAVEQSEKKKTILVLDEIDKARPVLDGFLLDFLQNGRISDPYLGVAIANSQNLIVIATSNDERLLSEPLYRRFRRAKLYLPNPEQEFKILTDMVGIDLINKIGKERVKFILSLANWQRKQEGVIKKVTTPEIARLLIDLAMDLTAEERVEVLLSWFSPHQEDWQLILSRFSWKYLEGML